MIRFPHDLTACSFLSRYWQKHLLAMPAALPGFDPDLDADELAWLATLDDVESRLVFTEETSDGARYRVEQGPFAATDLAALPAENWTLLVHDAEKHLPELRLIFEAVSFLPDWRIDDLMISVAAPGGSVGPHSDNYDVFLCQASGTREWRLTADPVPADPTASDELALLAAFAPDTVFQASQGDVLYLPPGIAHWGIASDLCMTCSIGMRAPTANEILAALNLNELSIDEFYTDPDLSDAESGAGRIAPATFARVRRLTDKFDDVDDEQLAVGFGRTVSAVKPWIDPDALADDEFAIVLRSIESGKDVRLHGMARIAFDSAHVYVNGSSFDLPESGRSWIATLASERVVRAAELRELLENFDAKSLLHTLIRIGVIELLLNESE